MSIRPWLAIWSMNLLLLSSVASAQTADEKAKISFEQGIKLFKGGDYTEAASAFARAYELKPSYRILYNIAQTENQLKRYASALKFYEQYINEGGVEIPAARMSEVQNEILRLRVLVGTIEVDSRETAASVYVDDVREGETPLKQPIRVNIGEHVVVVKKDGVELHRERIRVGGEQKVLVRVGGGSAPTPVVESPADERLADTTGVLPEESEAKEPAVAAEEDEPSPPRLWTWVALGVGGAAAIGAGVTGGLAIQTKGDLDSACDGATCPADQQDNIDKFDTLTLSANILTGVAAVGIAAGVVLFFFEPDWFGDETVTVTPAATPESAGLTLHATF